MSHPHRNRFARLFAAWASAAAALAAWAQSPALDPGFGEGGRAWVGASHTGAAAREAHVALQPDGSVLVMDGLRLVRFDARGSPDPDFGYGDAGVAGGTLAEGWSVHSAATPVVSPDGSIVVPLLVTAPGRPGRIAVLKLRADGRRDTSFGNDGVAIAADMTPPRFNVSEVFGAAVEPGGRIVVAGRVADALQWRIALARFTSVGQADERYGPGGYGPFDHLTSFPSSRFRAAADGSFALAYTYRDNAFVLRLLPGGEPDAAFGPARSASAQIDPFFESVVSASTVVDTDGTVVAAWNYPTWCNIGGCQAGTLLARFGADGELLSGFGEGGRIEYRGVYDHDAAPYPLFLAPLALTIDAGGGLVVLGRAGTVHRLDGRGVPDPQYSNGGVAVIRDEAAPLGLAARSFVVAADGSVLLAAGLALRGVPGSSMYERRGALYRVRATWEGRAGDATVVEYQDAQSGHYFVTPLVHEQQVLDRDGRWQRTGRAFAAWSPAGDDTRDVCRFFSHGAFAPKSTHFYTHRDAECASLKERREWMYEGTTFAVRLPEGPAEQRSCPPGTVPLHRAYNNGQGSAPNHRYTTDVAVLDEMIARGWAAEGEGSARIFACVAGR